MITLLGSLLGFIGAMIPAVLKALQDAHDKKHELAILSLQIQADEKRGRSKLAAIEYAHDVEATKVLYKTYNTGILWVDALNGTVRPIIAYSFFLLYAVIKYLQMLEDSLLWDEEDQAIFASVISFYFGQRSMLKNGHH